MAHLGIRNRDTEIYNQISVYGENSDGSMQYAGMNEPKTVAILLVYHNKIYTNAFKVFNQDLALRKALNIDIDMLDVIEPAYIKNLLYKLKEFDIVLVDHWASFISKDMALFEYLSDNYDITSNVIFLGHRHEGIINKQVITSSVNDDTSFSIDIDSQFECMLECYNNSIEKHRLATTAMLSIGKARKAYEIENAKKMLEHTELEYKSALRQLISRIDDKGKAIETIQVFENMAKFIGEEKILKRFNGTVYSKAKASEKYATAYADFYNKVYKSLSYNNGYGIRYQVYGDNRVEFPFAFAYYNEYTDAMHLKEGYQALRIELIGVLQNEEYKIERDTEQYRELQTTQKVNNQPIDLVEHTFSIKEYTKIGIEPSVALAKLALLRDKVDTVDITKTEANDRLRQLASLIYSLYNKGIYLSILNKNMIEFISSIDIDIAKEVKSELHKTFLKSCVYRSHIIKDNIKRKWFIDYNDDNTTLGKGW